MKSEQEKERSKYKSYGVPLLVKSNSLLFLKNFSIVTQQQIHFQQLVHLAEQVSRAPHCSMDEAAPGCPGPRPLTSHLLLQAEDDSHSLVEDEQLRLRLLALEVKLAHAAQLLERLVNVSHTQALPRVVRHPSLLLSFYLLLWV